MGVECTLYVNDCELVEHLLMMYRACDGNSSPEIFKDDGLGVVRIQYMHKEPLMRALGAFSIDRLQYLVALQDGPIILDNDLTERLGIPSPFA